MNFCPHIANGVYERTVLVVPKGSQVRVPVKVYFKLLEENKEDDKVVGYSILRIGDIEAFLSGDDSSAVRVSYTIYTVPEEIKVIFKGYDIYK